MNHESLPFGLGETLKGTDDDGNLINNEVLGKVFMISANNITNTGSPGLTPRLTSKQVKVVALRNTLGAALLGKRLALLADTAGYDAVETVNGYSASLGTGRVVAVDPYLPTAGCADDDIFWGIVGGTTTILTADSGAEFNGAISVGDPLVAASGTTTGSTSEGRVANAAIANATDAQGAFDHGVNLVGTALSARTTGETSADLLVELDIRRY